jgi:hypothetical protein
MNSRVFVLRDGAGSGRGDGVRTVGMIRSVVMRGK